MALPSQSDPVPSKIRPQSSNQDVRRFVANLLQRLDSDITNERAWEMASMFHGDGYDALVLDGKEWEKLFGETLGKFVYERFVRFNNERVDERQNEYVDVNFDYSKVHVDTNTYYTIWPYLRHIYRNFILLLVINTGRTIFEKEAFTIDKG